MKLQKVLILIAMPIIIGLFIDNFHPGYYLDQRDWPYKLYISFFNDLALPFCLYFALCLFEKWLPELRTWQVKACIAFLLPACFEMGQFFYQQFRLAQVFETYGGAFDPLDLFAYAVGALSAVLLERQVFARFFQFWEQNSHSKDLELRKI